jgi:hypothetical protein
MDNISFNSIFDYSWIHCKHHNTRHSLTSAATKNFIEVPIKTKYNFVDWTLTKYYKKINELSRDSDSELKVTKSISKIDDIENIIKENKIVMIHYFAGPKQTNTFYIFTESFKVGELVIKSEDTQTCSYVISSQIDTCDPEFKITFKVLDKKVKISPIFDDFKSLLANCYELTTLIEYNDEYNKLHINVRKSPLYAIIKELFLTKTKLLINTPASSFSRISKLLEIINAICNETPIDTPRDYGQEAIYLSEFFKLTRNPELMGSIYKCFITISTKYSK